ncbi:MAG: HAMP domain-containing histidine kinase [Candidatus Delongbacteria bacterium]|nr:HAMP domain-containing histidine kinase [Candidatus Delongbacteria bacterium]MBN2836356.1 HAMP domain-containing histidine kinase [Candidatus Delongbacteria bacterium]
MIDSIFNISHSNFVFRKSENSNKSETEYSILFQKFLRGLISIKNDEMIYNYLSSFFSLIKGLDKNYVMVFREGSGLIHVGSGLLNHEKEYREKKIPSDFMESIPYEAVGYYEVYRNYRNNTNEADYYLIVFDFRQIERVRTLFFIEVRPKHFKDIPPKSFFEQIQDVLKIKFSQTNSIEEHGQDSDDIASVSSGIAHYINNALCGIRGYADLLELYGSQHMDEITAIKDITENSSLIINSLLNLSKKTKKEHGIVKVNTVLEQAIEESKKRDSSVLFVYDRRLAGNLMVSGNTEHLLFSILAILQNSVEAFQTIERSKKTVSINVSASEESVKIIVLDNGQGISPENLQQVFKPFYSTKSSLAEKSGANYGLGLSLTKKYIEESDGTIEIESSFGDWTRVIVTLSRINNG